MSVVPVDAIIKAVEGLYWVYENCIVSSNAAGNDNAQPWIDPRSPLMSSVADIQYWDFGRRVKNFLESGGRLHGAIAKASRPNTGQGLGIGSQAQRLIADFQQIAGECKVILRDKKAFGQKRNNALVNLSWHAGGSAKRVETLKQQMQNHEREVHFFIQSYQPNARETKLDELLELAKRLNKVGPKPKVEDFEVPPGLKKRFTIAQRRHPPPPEAQAKEALVAAAGHLDQSTKYLKPGEQQTVYTYINLRKAQWLLLLLRQAQKSEEHDAGEFLEAHAEELEDQCAQELARKDLVLFVEHDFQCLPDSAFFIWVFQDYNAPPDESVEKLNEKLVYEAEIPAPRGALSCRLQVYRQLGLHSMRRSSASQASTGTNLRIVRTWQMAAGSESPRISIQQMNTFKDAIYMVYLFTQNLNDQFRVDLRCNSSSSSIRYDFDSFTDLYRFQWALSCFTVASDTPNVKFTLAQALTHQKHMPSGNSRIQMWLWDPEERLTKTDAQYPSSSDASSAGQTSLSTVTSPVYLPLDPDVNSPILANGEVRQRNYSKQTIHQTLLPYPPLLVLFEHGDKDASCICIELKDGVDIDPFKCDCKQKPGSCKRAVIKRSGGTLKAIRVYPDPLSRQGLPNLAPLSKPDHRGQNPHPDLYQGPESETIEMTQVVLSFLDTQTRSKFVKAFNLTSEIRRRTEKAGSLAEEIVRQRASISSAKGIDLARSETRYSLLRS